MFRRGLFPSVKTYYLDDELVGLKNIPAGTVPTSVFRAKGITSKAQSAMTADHFDAKNLKTNIDKVSNAWKLRPFPNLTVGITPMTRRLNRAINVKRYFLVRSAAD